MQQRGFRSGITTQGRRMAGARALWRATGMKKEDFQKPIIALVEDGDIIKIDIPKRSINVLLSADELAERRKKMEAKGTDAYKPLGRKRPVSAALRAYAALTTSAARGAVRDVTQV